MNPRELDWLRRLCDLSQMLGSEADPSLLPELILDAALELTAAERAFLVRVQRPDSSGSYRFSVIAARGFTRGELAGEAGEVSRTVVELSLKGEGRAVITSRPKDAALLGVSSLAAAGVHSVVCVPLRLRGELVGVLYLDHKSEEELFLEQDLPILQAFATQAALSLELAREPQSERTDQPGEYLVGTSAPMLALLAEVRRVALCRDPVLICGEAGTELALAAREVHEAGGERDEPFGLLTCGTGPDLARRMLRGDESGGRLGTRGTLCLERIELMEPGLQTVLSRALQDGTFTVPGTSRRLPVQARLVALTHSDLAERVRTNAFRAELYYRFDVQRLVVPPLRQRREDLPALCALFWRREGLRPLTIDPSAMQRMQEFGWPGNLLELEGELRRLSTRVIKTLRPEDLREEVRQGVGVVHDQADFTGRTLGQLKEDLVRAALVECGGVKSRAARQLGISRSTLYHLIARYAID